jgi:hypothetical protein
MFKGRKFTLMAFAIANVTEIGGEEMYPTTVDENTLVGWLTDQHSSYTITNQTDKYVELTTSSSFVIRVYNS